jgi:hypothetical protein
VCIPLISQRASSAREHDLMPSSRELGIHVCGARGSQSRQTPHELEAIGDRIGFDGAALCQGEPAGRQCRQRSGTGGLPPLSLLDHNPVFVIARRDRPDRSRREPYRHDAEPDPRHESRRPCVGEAERLYCKTIWHRSQTHGLETGNAAPCTDRISPRLASRVPEVHLDVCDTSCGKCRPLVCTNDVVSCTCR